MKLTRTERIILSNQYRILAALDPQEANSTSTSATRSIRARNPLTREEIATITNARP